LPGSKIRNGQIWDKAVFSKRPAKTQKITRIKVRILLNIKGFAPIFHHQKGQTIKALR